MPLGPDASYRSSARFYVKQQPAGTVLNGNTITTEEILDVGGLSQFYGVSAFNGQIQAGLIQFTITPGASTVCQISIQVQDNGAQNITQTDGKTPTVFDLDVILALANGTVSTTVPSTGLAVTTGTLLNTYVPTGNRAIYAQTNASGLLVVTITDTARSGFYLMVQAGMQPIPSISRQLVAGDYG